MNATAKDLRFHSKELLEAVKKGEEVIITYRGKPCAKLIPLKTTKKKRNATDELFGIWKDHKEMDDVEEYVRGLRKGRF